MSIVFSILAVFPVFNFSAPPSVLYPIKNSPKKASYIFFPTVNFPLDSLLLFDSIIVVRNSRKIRPPAVAIFGYLPIGSDGETVEGSGIEVTINLEMCQEKSLRKDDCLWHQYNHVLQ